MQGEYCINKTWQLSFSHALWNKQIAIMENESALSEV